MIFHRKTILPAAIALLAVSVLAYGLLIPWLGFYSDDWLFLWIGQKLGSAGLARYFTTNRPFWGLLYQVSMPLLGSAPAGWHIFALLSRWLNALAAWGLVSLAWPGERRRAALWTALLLLVYPGYKLQPIAITFGHLFLVLTFFLASLACSLLAARKPARAWLFTLPGLLLSAANLLMMEYFFVLELLRPLLLYLTAPRESPRSRFLLTIKRWWPYLVTFLAVTLWRTVFFQYQTHIYKMTFVDQLSSAPLAAVIDFLRSFLQDLWVVLGLGWGNAFTQIPINSGSIPTRLAWAVLLLFTALATFTFLILLPRRSRPESTPSAQAAIPTIPGMLIFSAAWLTLAGLPFLLTGLRVEVDWIYSRFTIPYIFGSALLIAALLTWVQQKLPRQSAWIPVLLISLLVGFSTGNQFLNTNRFRADWKAQQAFYWQMAWRLPALQTGTTLLINEQNTYAGSPTYLTAAANWFYAPQVDGPNSLYQVLFTREGFASLTAAEAAQNELSADYLGLPFRGRSQDVVVLVYNGPCLRVLDPELDAADPTLDDYSIQAMRFSHPERITLSTDTDASGALPFTPDPILLSREPEHNWCYWSAQASLAQQRADWDAIVQIGDAHLDPADLTYKTAFTYLPFIEGYAHLARWETALELSSQYYQVVENRPLLDEARSQNQASASAMICRLWQRTAEQTPASQEKNAAMAQAWQQYSCTP